MDEKKRPKRSLGKRRKRLNMSERMAIEKLYAEGSHTLDEIAKRFGCTKAVVSVIGHTAGLSRKQAYTDKELELIMRGKELGFDVVAEMITANGHPTTEHIVRMVFQHYSKKKD